jgi:hypothetical protein
MEAGQLVAIILMSVSDRQVGTIDIRVQNKKLSKFRTLNFGSCPECNTEEFYWVCSKLSLMNEKAQFKVVLKRYLNTHSIYSVDEFLLSKNDASF